MFCYLSTNLIQIHFSLIVFFLHVKGAIYLVNIATVIFFKSEDNILFWRVKISRFREKAHL